MRRRCDAFTDTSQGGKLKTSPAALTSPAGPGPFPAMLDMWGMGGGLMEYRAALLASRGYASLALAYIGHKDLPGDPKRMNVGDLYFQVGGLLGLLLSLPPCL